MAIVGGADYISIHGAIGHSGCGAQKKKNRCMLETWVQPGPQRMMTCQMKTTENTGCNSSSEAMYYTREMD
jgi:hypothetical protein